MQAQLLSKMGQAVVQAAHFAGAASDRPEGHGGGVRDAVGGNDHAPICPHCETCAAASAAAMPLGQSSLVDLGRTPLGWYSAH